MPFMWSKRSGAVKSTPVPPAPAVPMLLTVTDSLRPPEPTIRVSPAIMLASAATLMLAEPRSGSRRQRGLRGRLADHGDRGHFVVAPDIDANLSPASNPAALVTGSWSSRQES